MKHTDILDLLETALALAQAIQIENEEGQELARQQIQMPIQVFHEELKALDPRHPSLERRLAGCVTQLLRIDAPD